MQYLRIAIEGPDAGEDEQHSEDHRPGPWKTRALRRHRLRRLSAVFCQYLLPHLAELFYALPVVGDTQHALDTRVLAHGRIMGDNVVSCEVGNACAMAQAEIVTRSTVLGDVRLLVFTGQGW